jgi:DNA-binding NarL/FixJ family response regulator
MISVMLVDDHPLVRAGLRTLIDSAPDLAVVAEAGGGIEAVEKAAGARPDVILMDLSMPGMDGVEATRRVLEVSRGTAVVVLTSFNQQARVRDAVLSGAVGYLLKDSEPTVLLDAIRSAARGDAPLDPRVARALLPAVGGSRVDGLSAREVQVLRLITEGLSNKQIGTRLGIAERTVKAHVGNVFKRIGVADRTSAAMWARDRLDDGLGDSVPQASPST